MEISAQREIGLYCIYDYQESLLSGSQSYSPSDTQVHYLSFAPNTRKDFGYREFGTFSQMMDAVSTGRDLLIVVHGYGVDMKRFSKRMKGFPERYDVDVLTFFWPANLHKSGNGPVDDFDYIRKCVSEMSPRFRQFMSEVSEYASSCDRKVSIIFLSLANVFAMNMARDIGKGDSTYLGFLDNIILNQPCVPVEGHTDWVGFLSSGIKRNLYIVSNENDKLLQLEETLYKTGRKLGRGVADGDKMSPDACYRDFSNYINHSFSPFFSHMYYLGPLEGDLSPVFDFYFSAFHGK